MVNTYGSTIRTLVLGFKPFKITWTFAQHIKGGYKTYAGIDIGTPIGTKIYAPEDGVVYRSRPSTSDGAEIICIKHKTCMTEYVHLYKRLVSKDQKVKKNQLIGLTGASGKVTGPHLHFALIKGTVYDNSKRVDPYSYLLVANSQSQEKDTTKLGTKLVPTSPRPRKLHSRPLLGPKLKLKLLNTSFGLIRFYTRHLTLEGIQAELIVAIKLRQVKGITNPNVVVYSFKNG